MTTLSSKEQIELLRKEICQCGRAKKRGHAFCHRCFNRLSLGVRDALYMRVPGFGESYERAVDELKLSERPRRARYSGAAESPRRDIGRPVPVRRGLSHEKTVWPLKATDPPPASLFGRHAQNGAARAARASKIAPATKVTPAPEGAKAAPGKLARPAETPLELLHSALRDSALAARVLQRFPSDPAAEIHGNLIVALGALRRATEATEKLLAIEEGQRG